MSTCTSFFQEIYNMDKTEKIFIYVLWFLQRRYRWNLTISTEKLYVFNRHCKIPPDSFYVFKNGPLFLRQCATNSTDIPIWGEMDSNFAAQSRIQPMEVSDICTTSNRRTCPNSAYQSPSLSSSIGCIRWPVRANSVYQDHRPLWIYSCWPGTIYILFSWTHRYHS